jgi:uncharacterized DUF497 family protein
MTRTIRGPNSDFSSSAERRRRFLIVVIEEREDTVRIISARVMTPRERKGYEQEPDR